MEGFWSFLTVVVTLMAALIPVTWAWFYDRHQRRLASHELWTSWITALKSEVSHELSSLKEMEDAFKKMKRENRLGGVTKRFNEDFFQVARQQVISHPRSTHIFPSLTKGFRDTAHTNAMLDRLEAELIRYSDQFDQTIEIDHTVPNRIQGLVPSILGSLVGVRASLEKLRDDLDEEIGLFEVIKPRMLPHNHCDLRSCDCDSCGPPAESDRNGD